jgi:hypothetical protein
MIERFFARPRKIYDGARSSGYVFAVPVLGGIFGLVLGLLFPIISVVLDLPRDDLPFVVGMMTILASIYATVHEVVSSLTPRDSDRVFDRDAFRKHGRWCYFVSIIAACVTSIALSFVTVASGSALPEVISFITVPTFTIVYWFLSLYFFNGEYFVKEGKSTKTTSADDSVVVDSVSVEGSNVVLEIRDVRDDAVANSELEKPYFDSKGLSYDIPLFTPAKEKKEPKKVKPRRIL